MNKVGLQTDVTEEGKINLNLAYFRFAEQFGAVTLIHPWEQEARTDLDLFIGIGGADISPYRYQKWKTPWLTANQNTNLEYFDMKTLPQYIKAKVPIVGICRHMQSLNVTFGGTLHEHVEEPTSISRGDIAHLAYDTRTNQIIGVNSMHHQAIKDLGDGFDVILQGYKKVKKKGDVLLQVEAIKHNELPIFAVQFHPEELGNNDNTKFALDWTLSEIHDIMEQGRAIRAAQQIQLGEVV